MSGLTLTFTTELSEKSLYSKILKLLHCCIDVIYRTPYEQSSKETEKKLRGTIHPKV